MYAKIKYILLLGVLCGLATCQTAQAQYNSSLTGSQVEAAINKVLATNAALVDVNDAIWAGKVTWLGPLDQTAIDALTPAQGDLVYNTTASDFQLYDGSAWQGLIGGGGGTDDQTAAEVPFTPAGSIAATDAQAAIEEVATDAAAGIAAKADKSGSESFTILEPDLALAKSDDLVLLKFPAELYPSGVTITSIHIDASAAYTSETFTFEHWDDSLGTTQATVEAITLTASASAEDDGTLSDATIPADSFLVLNGDDTPEDILWVIATVTFDF